ncbi:hypothetical protein [Butyrivibrio sp. AC2005]|uniref:hypothetical protein n=1 Tax=Butyrivibrio sp. AC2005 TaxID=1280672 RepID=UPI0003F6EC02|nr:hypothetical protein [Butyrivibrio sp. AC2005]
MKKRSTTALVTRVLSMMLAFAMVVMFVNPITAAAKTKKIKLNTVSDPKFTASYAESVAKTLNKGNYRITIKKKGYAGRAFAKFTAPASKVYKFTEKNLRASNGRYANGYFYICTPQNEFDPDSISQTDVSTNNGKTESAMFFASKKGSNGFYTKRFGQIYLNQGQTIYLYFSSDGIRAKSVSFDFSIK